MRGDARAGGFWCLAVAVFLGGCAAPAPVGGPVRDGRYDSYFPQQDAAPVIERVASSVQMVTAIAFYKVYAIPENDSLKASLLVPGALELYESEARFVNTVNIGASTILSLGSREILVLTCAHVVEFPDTILSYYPSASGDRTTRLSSVALRVRASVTIAVLPEGGELELLAADGEADIALLGKHFTRTPVNSIRAFDYPFGAAADLDWGTFVYVLGYPRGQLMLTRGLVSLGRLPASEGFLLDAGMGRGFSGGPVLAIRDGLPGVEWVGMARMMPGQTSFVLAPGLDEGGVEYDQTMPYRGEAYVHRQTELHYGMARAISAESIMDFLERHREATVAAGYAPPPIRRHRDARPTD